MVQQFLLPFFFFFFFSTVCLLLQHHQILSFSSGSNPRRIALFDTTTTTTTSTSRRMSSSSAMGDDNNNNHKDGLKVLGVCGGIGSGKSSASKLLVSDLGCIKHLDADTIAHSVYEPGSQAIKDVVNGFGTDILEPNSEMIDRKKLGSIVFSDRKEMAKLERIVWPHVKTKLKNRIEEIRDEWQQGQQQKSKQQQQRRRQQQQAPASTEEGDEQDNDSSSSIIHHPIIIVEAAVLLDAGWDDILDGIWVVTTKEQIALRRLIETRNLSEEEALKRINAQNTRRGIATLDEEVDNGIVSAVIENNGSLNDLKQSLQDALNDPKSWKRKNIIN